MPFRSSAKFSYNLLRSSSARRYSILILVLGLAFFIPWLANYSWTIISSPYPAEYREGSILLMTDFLIHGRNPFMLVNHPLMTNNYGFIYSLTVLPFAQLFGNTLAVHRAISILFIFASCILIVLTLLKLGTALPFAVAGGTIVMGCLLFSTTPLSRPDGLGQFFFLLAILFPVYRKFDAASLIISGAAGILAFLAKPYFVFAIGMVAAYAFLFVSKNRGLIYGCGVLGSLVILLYGMNLFLETYFLDVILSNAGNSSLTFTHMADQSILFLKVFLPILLLLPIASFTERFENGNRFPDGIGDSGKPTRLDLSHLNRPLFDFSTNYFGFYLLCSSMVVMFWLGRHSGAYMTYYFQLITPALVLYVFQPRDVFQKQPVLTVVLILVNLSLICFYLLFPNKLSRAQIKEWERLYQSLRTSRQVLNSPVLVSEMIRLGMLPTDSGQSEYYFNITPYPSNPFAPDYKAVEKQGVDYLRSIRTRVSNQKYDQVMITFNKGFTPFAGRALIDKYYDRFELIPISMPQTNQEWTIEISKPRR